MWSEKWRGKVKRQLRENVTDIVGRQHRALKIQRQSGVINEREVKREYMEVESRLRKWRWKYSGN